MQIRIPELSAQTPEYVAVKYPSSSVHILHAHTMYENCAASLSVSGRPETAGIKTPKPRAARKLAPLIIVIGKGWEEREDLPCSKLQLATL